MTPFLIFDAYGTLVELDDFYGRLQRGFATHDVELPLAAVRHAARCEMRYYIANVLRACIHDAWLAVRRECALVLRDAIREQGHPLDLPPETLLQILGDAIVFHVFSEVREVLEALHQRGIAMGVMSNWDYQLPRIFEALKLDGFFNFIGSSCEAGAEKPAPPFFAFGLQRARAVRPDLMPQECFYIGDHYQKDVLPARAAGMTPLWLVRDLRDVASGDVHEAQDPVVRLQTLRDLIPLFP